MFQTHSWNLYINLLGCHLYVVVCILHVYSVPFLSPQVPCIRDYSQCNVNGTVTLSTDVYTYVGAVTTLTISVNTTEVEESTLYYKICSNVGDTESYTLLSCVQQNSSVFESAVDWDLIGVNVLTVGVYRDDAYSSLVDCYYTQVVVASESTFLFLSVTDNSYVHDV